MFEFFDVIASFPLMDLQVDFMCETMERRDIFHVDGNDGIKTWN